MSAQKVALYACCTIVFLLLSEAIGVAADQANMGLKPYLEKKIHDLNVSDEAVRIALCLMWEAHSGVLSNTVKAPPDEKTPLPELMAVPAEEDPNAVHFELPPLVDSDLVVKAIDGVPSAVDSVVREQVFQLVWRGELAQLVLRLQKSGRTGQWRLVYRLQGDSDPGRVEHICFPFRTGPPYRQEFALRELVRAAADEVQRNSSKVPDDVSDPKEAARYFPTYQAILLLRSMFSVKVVQRGSGEGAPKPGTMILPTPRPSRTPGKPTPPLTIPPAARLR